MARHCPPWKAEAVSQYWQRSGQPVRRTNTVGQPASRASPCSDRKISVMRSRSADAAAASTGAETAFMERIVEPGRVPGPVLTHRPQRAARLRLLRSDRKSVVWGKRVSVRVALGGGRIIKKKKK